MEKKVSMHLWKNAHLSSKTLSPSCRVWLFGLQGEGVILYLMDVMYIPCLPFHNLICIPRKYPGDRKK